MILLQQVGSYLFELQNRFSICETCCIFANVAFWVASIANLIVDELSKTNGYLLSLKLQPKRHLSHRELRDVFLLTVFNMVIVAPFVCCPIFEVLWDNLHSFRLTVASPFVWKRELLLLPVDMFVNEVTFYAAHYLLHQPLLYSRIHKVHHRFQAPTAMTAAYAHPVEFIFGNVLCIGLGPILTNAHPFTAFFWFSAAMLSTCKGHSGYDWLNAATHDAHHQYTMYNFGVLHFGDYIMGTSLPKEVALKKGDP